MKPTGFKRCAKSTPSPARLTGWPLCLALIAVVASLVLLPARAALAWGRLAHWPPAKLADSRLSSRTRAAIRELLEPGRPESREWLKGRAEDWAEESLLVGLRAYRIPGSNGSLRSGDSVGRDYERENVPRAADRLARSGVRLAAMLEDVFNDDVVKANPIRTKQPQRSASPAPK